MSITVNGTNISIYSLDTNETIANRVGAVFRVDSDYLYYPNLKLFQKGDKVEVVNLVQLAKDTKDFDAFINQITAYLQPRKLVDNLKSIQFNLSQIWLTFHYKNVQNDLQFKTRFASTVKEFNTKVDNSYIFALFNDSSIRQIQKQMESKLELFIKDTKTTDKSFQEFEEVKEYHYTPFVTVRLKSKVKLSETDKGIMELFNDIVLTKSVPFAKINNFYKVEKKSKIYQDWINHLEEEDTINIFVNNTKLMVNKFENFIHVVIREINNDIFAEYEFPFTEGKQGNLVSEKEFQTRLLSVFQKVSITSQQNISRSGFFNFPNSFLDTYVFSDMCYFNKPFSDLININELNKVTKKASGDRTQPKLYFTCYSPLTGFVSANIGQKTVSPYDSFYDNKEFIIDQPYIRVYCREIADNSVKFFTSIISRLLALYYESKQPIIDFYRQLVPAISYINYDEEGNEIKESQEFGMDVLVASRQRKHILKYVEPNIFINTYSRQCTHAPIIVSESEAKSGEYKNYIIFPRDYKDSNPRKYESDGVRQRYYVSPHKDFPYVSVRFNLLQNKNEYPVIPCCYKTKDADAYNYYYNNVEIEEKETPGQIITTSKILKYTGKGYVPKKLESMLKVLFDKSVLRYGVDRSPSSFIECLMLATNYKGFTNEPNRLANVQQIRQQMANTPKYINLTRQSTYELSNEQVQQDMLDITKYFNPKLYCQLLENVFKCNIYLFSVDDGMFLPNFINSYYVNTPFEQSVMILEHLGSESDNLEYPQCEILMLDNNILLNNTTLTQDFNKLNNFFVLNRHVEPIYLNLPGNHKVVSQVIDTYGKTRQLNIKSNTNTYTVFTSPIPPLRVDIDQTIFDENIPFNIDTNAELLKKPIRDNKSALEKFNTNRKTSRYLVEYMFWLFSKYIAQKGGQPQKYIDHFVSKYLIVDDKVSYTSIDKKFENETRIVRDGKLVCNSSELKTRLGYVLYLQARQNPKLLSEYVKHKHIKNYYQDSADFTQHASQIVFQNIENVELWLNEKYTTHVLTDKVVQHLTTPYFFKNKVVSDSIYLAQNVRSVEQALVVHKKWREHHINIGQTNVTDSDIRNDFDLYVYVNRNDITKYEIGKVPSEVKILGYRIKDDIFYTVLLPL